MQNGPSFDETKFLSHVFLGTLGLVLQKLVHYFKNENNNKNNRIITRIIDTQGGVRLVQSPSQQIRNLYVHLFASVICDLRKWHLPVASTSEALQCQLRVPKATSLTRTDASEFECSHLCHCVSICLHLLL